MRSACWHMVGMRTRREGITRPQAVGGRPRPSWVLPAMALGLASALSAPIPLTAQRSGAPDTAHAHQAELRARHVLRFSGEATLAATHQVGTAVGRRAVTEAFITRPVAAAHGSFWNGTVALVAEFNFEGLTMRRGELTPGIYGESYYDRRHPHTLVHDVVVSLARRGGPVDGSLSVGRGFAPFGTDDPMSRPFLKFPVNHHLAQLLERAVVIGAVHARVGRTSSITAEASVFNGDDPVGPYAPPEWDRIGDSWSTRLTATPFVAEQARVELQVSHARVKSPDVPAGWGLDQRKWSTSGRLESGSHRYRPYALVEWAATDVYSGEFRAFRLSTALGEGAVQLGALEFAARVERADRPEEERALDAYRTVRPPHDLTINGITRWDVASLRAARSLFVRHGFASGVFAEMSRARPRARLSPSAFEPEQFYGTSAIWAFTAGVRFGGGLAHGRMGRYGVASDDGHRCLGSCPSRGSSLGGHDPAPPPGGAE